MGRKPNQLIVEYFQRGAKIADASNRYEHTCKLCGEHFPKGRTDNLTAHLTKKCPALNTIDRTKIVLRLHDLAGPNVDPSLDLTARGGSHTELGGSVELPFSPTRQQNFDGLNVLAEASRRVGGDGPEITGYAAVEQAHEAVPLDPQLQGISITANDEAIANNNGMFDSNADSQPVLDAPLLSLPLHVLRHNF